MSFIEHRTYINKYGGYIGRPSTTCSTLSIPGVNTTLAGNNSGLWSVNDYYQAIKFGRWPVESDKLIQNFDTNNFYSYPEGGSVVYDLTALSGGKNGTIINASYDNTVNAILFNGATHTVALSSSYYSSMGGANFSVEAVFNRVTTFLNTNQVLFNFAGASTSGGYRLYANNSTFYWDGGTGTPSVGTTISNNTFYYVVGVRSATGIYMYLNGSLVSSNTNSTPVLNSSNPRIGYDSDNNGLRWVGYLSEFRVYDKALTSTDVANNFAVRRRVYSI